MNNEWQNFLQKYVLTNDKEDIFPYSSYLNETTLLTLPTLDGLLEVNGQAAEKFLQGQLSCDVHLITLQNSALAVHCNYKGRVIATLRVIKCSDTTYFLLLPQNMLPILQPVLEKYAFFSKVKLQNRSDQWVSIGMIGNKAYTILSKLFPQLSLTLNQVISLYEKDRCFIITLPGEIVRFQIIAHVDVMTNILQLLQPLPTFNTTALWEWIDILSGIATIYPATSAQFTPHHLNYQLIGGVSFSKGCYTGQEIIARTHYLGQIKQQLFYCQIKIKNKCPQPEDKIYNEVGEIGVIVNCCEVDVNTYDCLAVLKKEIMTQNKPIYYLQPQGIKINVLRLPYSN